MFSLEKSVKTGPANPVEPPLLRRKEWDLLL